MNLAPNDPFARRCQGRDAGRRSQLALSPTCARLTSKPGASLAAQSEDFRRQRSIPDMRAATAPRLEPSPRRRSCSLPAGRHPTACRPPRYPPSR